MAKKTADEGGDAWLEKGRKLFSGPCCFVAGAARAEDLPAPELREVALVGRSNVGKSSIINALTGRKGLARVSNTPGRTQQINFFLLGEDEGFLVDLPGYGYAKTSQSKADDWLRLMAQYLESRPTLARVCVLVDSRHDLKSSDGEMIAFLEHAGVPYTIVLTKADKLPAVAQKKKTSEVLQELAKHTSAKPDIILTSTVRNTGIDILRAVLARSLQTGA